MPPDRAALTASEAIGAGQFAGPLNGIALPVRDARINQDVGIDELESGDLADNFDGLRTVVGGAAVVCRRDR